MSNKIALAVFDIAGTTIRDNGEITAAFQAALAEYGYTVPAEKINPLMGYKKPQAIALLLEEFENDRSKITGSRIAAMHHRFVEMMKEHYTTSRAVTPMPHATEIFAYLKQKGSRIGLDTGFSSDITQVIMERLGWVQEGLVDYVVSSNEVPAGRPHPFMIQKMMQLAGVTDTRTVIKTGDTEVDVQEGKNAGCLYSIAVTTGAFTRSQLEPYQPSYILDDLKELIPIIDHHT